MAYKAHKYCLYCSIQLGFMLIYQVGTAQYNFNKVDSLTKGNLEEFRERSVLFTFNLTSKGRNEK